MGAETSRGPTPPTRLSRRDSVTAALSALAAGSLGLWPSGCARDRGETVVKLTRGVMSLAHWQNTLVWVTGPDNGKLFVAPVGGDPVRPLAEGLHWPRQLRCSRGSAWLACQDKLLKVSLAGSTRRSWPAEQALQLAASGEQLFWTQADGSLHCLDGAQPRSLARHSPRPSALAAAGGSAFWASGQPAVLRRTDLTGQSQLLTTQRAIFDIVARQDELLFTTDEGLFSIPQRGGAPTALLKGLRSPTALMWHGDANYLIDGARQGRHRLLRLPQGEKQAQLVAQLPAPQAITAIGQQLFVADSRQRRLLRYPIA